MNSLTHRKILINRIFKIKWKRMEIALKINKTIKIIMKNKIDKSEELIFEKILYKK
jgi:hypothetical protein